MTDPYNLRNPRPKKGDMVIELRNREGSYRLHASKERVKPEVMDRINERITRLGMWVAYIGKEEWPLPEFPGVIVPPSESPR